MNQGARLGRWRARPPEEHGRLNVSGSVPRKRAPLLNALGSSLPAGQKRERERRPEGPRRALLHARGALCANAVHARVVLAERRRSRKRGGETQRPRRSLSEAAVKKCGVAFPRPRVNGSVSDAPCEPSPKEQSGQIRRFAASRETVPRANPAGYAGALGHVRRFATSRRRLRGPSVACPVRVLNGPLDRRMAWAPSAESQETPPAASKGSASASWRSRAGVDERHQGAHVGA